MRRWLTLLLSSLTAVAVYACGGAAVPAGTSSADTCPLLDVGPPPLCHDGCYWAADSKQCRKHSGINLDEMRASRERVARIGAATSMGGRISDMDKVVTGMTSGFTRCYEFGLRRDPNMAGSVRVIAKVGPTGKVLSASPSGGDGLSAEVILCVVRVVEAATFSPPEGGNATITIPIAMSL